MDQKNDEKDNYIIIIYKPKENNDTKVRIFGKEFVKNNKDKCCITYRGKCYELKEFFEDIDCNYNHNGEILLTLNGINNITDISYFFAECDNIETIILLKDNFFNVTNLIEEDSSENNSSINLTNNANSFCSSIKRENNFYGDLSLIYSELSNIPKSSNSSDEMDEKKFLINPDMKAMTHLFYKCSSLISLPDISKLNTSNITDMSCMFEGCGALKTLPDISKWDTHNVKDISCMFKGCNSVISLPDISKWDISNVTKIKYLFSECSSLISFPKISGWNT